MTYSTSVAALTNATTLAFSQSRMLSDQNSQGTMLGDTSADPVGFYGSNPVAQQATFPNTVQATAALDTGTLIKAQFTNATTSVNATTTAEQTSTIVGVLAGDIVAGNKPSATAGIGIAGYRVSAANTIGINYSNASSGAITTTAETYDVIDISSNYVITQALTPAAVPALIGSEQFFTVNGATLGTFPIVNKPTAQAGLGVANARVSAQDQVAITFLNNSSGAITPAAAESYAFAFLPTLPAADHTVVYRFTPATTAVAQTTSAEVTTAVTGLLANDIVAGVSKPSAQTGLGVGGYRVSSAGNIAVQMTNAGAAVTTTAESYTATVQRAIAKAPFVVTTQSLAPTSVAANTTAEQTFTVNLLNASTSVLVSKPSYTPGLYVVNARVSAASTLAITYQNNNSAAVVPPTEVYTIAAVPLQGPGASTTAGTTNSITVGFQGAGSVTANVLRQALINLGLIGNV